MGMSIVVCASEDSVGAKPSDDILNFSFSANPELMEMENMPRMMQQQSTSPWLPGGDTISVLNETGVSPEPPIDVIIF